MTTAIHPTIPVTAEISFLEEMITYTRFLAGSSKNDQTRAAASFRLLQFQKELSTLQSLQPEEGVSP